MPGMREDATTDDYRKAVSGEGEFGSLGYEWLDKPHRLVYDLCAEVDKFKQQIEIMREALQIIAGERQCLDNLMSNRDVAREALRLVKHQA